jgi:hypothetical protein
LASARFTLPRRRDPVVGGGSEEAGKIPSRNHSATQARDRGGDPGGRVSLVIHAGALGDVLLAIPALRAIRHLDPSAPLVLAAAPRIAGLLGALAEVDRGVSLESLELHRLFADDETATGAPVTPDVLARASRVVCWLGAQDPAFVRRLTRLIPGATVARSVGAEEPVWRHLLETVAGTREGHREPLAVSDALAGAGAGLLAAAGWDRRSSIVLVHPGAGGLDKRWPPGAFATVLDGLTRAAPLQVVVHRGPADADAVIELQSRLARPALVLDEPPLPTLAGALRHVAVFVGNDSGVSHLAAAVGAPAVILFTAAKRRWRPWARGVRVVEVRAGWIEARDVARVGRAVRAALGRGGRRTPPR